MKIFYRKSFRTKINTVTYSKWHLHSRFCHSLINEGYQGQSWSGGRGRRFSISWRDNYTFTQKIIQDPRPKVIPHSFTGAGEINDHLLIVKLLGEKTEIIDLKGPTHG